MTMGAHMPGAHGIDPPSPPRPTRPTLHLSASADLGSVIAHVAAQPAGWWEAEPTNATVSETAPSPTEDWPEEGPVVPRD